MILTGNSVTQMHAFFCQDNLKFSVSVKKKFLTMKLTVCIIHTKWYGYTWNVKCILNVPSLQNKVDPSCPYYYFPFKDAILDLKISHKLLDFPFCGLKFLWKCDKAQFHLYSNEIVLYCGLHNVVDRDIINVTFSAVGLMSAG